MVGTPAGAEAGKVLLGTVARELGIMFMFERHRTAPAQFDRLNPDHQAAAITHMRRLAQDMDFTALHALLRNGFQCPELLKPASPLEELLKSLDAEVINLGGYPEAAQHYDELHDDERERFATTLGALLGPPPRSEAAIARARQLIGLSLAWVAGCRIASARDIRSMNGHRNEGDVCLLKYRDHCPHDWAVYIAAKA